MTQLTAAPAPAAPVVGTVRVDSRPISVTAYTLPGGDRLTARVRLTELTGPAGRGILVEDREAVRTGRVRTHMFVRDSSDSAYRRIPARSFSAELRTL